MQMLFLTVLKCGEWCVCWRSYTHWVFSYHWAIVHGIGGEPFNYPCDWTERSGRGWQWKGSGGRGTVDCVACDENTGQGLWGWRPGEVNLSLTSTCFKHLWSTWRGWRKQRPLLLVQWVSCVGIMYIPVSRFAKLVTHRARELSRWLVTTRQQL